jgi:hypothetical protein
MMDSQARLTPFYDDPAFSGHNIHRYLENLSPVHPLFFNGFIKTAERQRLIILFSLS